MKKSLLLAVIIIAALCFAACTKGRPGEEVTTPAPTEQQAEAPTSEPTEEPTEVPTEAPTEEPTPEPTEVPTEEPTEIPTEAPTPEPTEVPTPEPTVMPTEVPVEAKPLPEGDYFAPVRAYQPIIVDMDGDGLDDIVLIDYRSDDTDYYCGYYQVIITKGSDPENPFTFATVKGRDVYGAIVDCDPSNAAKELVLCFILAETDASPVTYAVRFKDDGSDFEYFYDYIDFFSYPVYHRGFPQDFVFIAEEGLPLGRRTEVLGTNFVQAKFLVTENGIEIISEEYTYFDDYTITLKRDLELTDENGNTITAKKGTDIIPYSTDLKTYVKVKLEDGTIGQAELSFGPDGYYPVYINGVKQRKYGDMPMAD